MTCSRRLPLAASLFAALLLAPLVGGQETPTADPGAPAGESSPGPAVAVTRLEVTPTKPAADTLCHLTVHLRNDGDKVASQLGFRVTVNGHELPVYRNHLFMDALPPGEETAVRLYNFWSTETSRPTLPDGKVTVEVTLQEAHWYSIEQKEEVEEWTPLEPVPGLPSTARATA